MRKPSPSNRGSRIGFVVDPFRKREVWFESGLEEDWLTVLIAMPEVDDIREQQTAFYYDEGQKRPHTFDAIATWKNGRRTAYAMKYRDDVVRKRLRETLLAVAECNGDSVADDYRILTEFDLDKTTIANARLTLCCASDFDDEGRKIVRSHLASQTGKMVRLGDLGAETGMGNRAYRAAIMLVYEGILVPPSGAMLGPNLVVENRAVTMPEKS